MKASVLADPTASAGPGEVLPCDALRHPWRWQRIDRSEALRLRHVRPVVAVHSAFGLENARWLDERHPCLRGDGPYALEQYRFFTFPISLLPGRIGSRMPLRTPRSGEADPVAAVAAVFPDRLPRWESPREPGPDPFRIWLEMDDSHPGAGGDVLILIDAAGSEAERIRVGEMEMDGGNHARLEFGNVDWSARYSLIRDPGPEADGGKEVLFEEMSPAEILAWCHGGTGTEEGSV